MNRKLIFSNLERDFSRYYSKKQVSINYTNKTTSLKTK